MSGLYLQVAGQLGAAWLAGGLVGFERSFHGRAAGFRTHALVALASSTAMIVALAPSFAPGIFPATTAAFEPTRLAQGVLTGVGFLGAGVIFKEGVNVQGLTTAASVWATAAVGLLFGLGEYGPGAIATAGLLATLLLLRWVEERLPTRVYAWAVLRFRSETAPDRDGLVALLARRNVTVREMSYARAGDGAVLEFRGNISGDTDGDFDGLAADLRETPGLVEFDLSRISK